MKKRFFLCFFVLGLVSIIAQVLSLRELMVTFYGNEFFLGLTLGIWLVWTATGSYLGKKYLNKKAFFINLILLTFFLPFTLILIRFLKTLFPAGVLVDFVRAIFLTFLCLAPLGFSLGFFFSTAFSFFETKMLSQLASRAYLIEILGFAAGGILLDFLLIKHSSLLLILILSFFILLLASLFLKNRVFLAPFFVLAILGLWKLPLLEEKTLAWQFPNLVETKNSIYGRTAVTKKNNQFNFYESGTLTGISQKTESAEYLIHPILLSHPNPKKVLLIGGGLDGALLEILKHKPKQVTYLELDPVLVATVKKYLESELTAVLKDNRVNLVLSDARKFLKETSEEYDVAIINLPPPSTQLINRLYTREAFAQIREILLEDGILAVNLAMPTDYFSQETKNLTSSLYQTINAEFEHVMVLPEYTLLFLASNEDALTDDTNLLAQRLKSREVQTDFITPSYLANRFHDDRIAMFVQELKKDAPVNYDFHPIAYFYQIAFWQGLFNPRAAAFLSKLPSNSLFILLLLLLAGAPLLFLLKRRRALPYFILGLAGATIMVWEIILIFSFQVKLGYIYQKISILLATVLTGMAVGNYLTSRFLKSPRFLRSLGFLKIVLILMITFSLTLPTILTKAEGQLIFFALATIAGILSGTIFPLITQEYLIEQKQVGGFYAADLVGSFVGAILTTLFLIPIFGLNTTSYFLTLFLAPIIFL